MACCSIRYKIWETSFCQPQRMAATSGAQVCCEQRHLGVCEHELFYAARWSLNHASTAYVPSIRFQMQEPSSRHRSNDFLRDVSRFLCIFASNLLLRAWRSAEMDVGASAGCELAPLPTVADHHVAFGGRSPQTNSYLLASKMRSMEPMCESGRRIV